MTAAQAIRAGQAYIEVGVRDNRLTAGLRAAQARVRAFGQGLQAAGTSLLGLGTLAAVPFALATKTYASFEQAMARVKALTNASADDFAALEKEALRLGATTVYTAAQAAQTMSVFALAGLQTRDILQATGPTLDLAAAGMMDLAQAADISMKVMKSMGLTTAELPYAIDVLAKAMVTANTDLVMLGEAFKYVGPVAKAAGLSLEETTAAIQMLSDAGIQADMAGTTLRGAILSLTSPSEEAKRMLRRLGVQTMDARGNFRSLADIVGDLEQALASMGTGKRLEAIGEIFANRQATGIAELVDQGAASLRKKTAALMEAQGTGARIAATQLDTLYGAWMLLTSALEGLANVIGKALAPVLREWGAALTEVTGVLIRLAENNQEVWPAVAQGIALVLGLGGALVAAGLAVQVVAVGLGGLATVLGVVGAAVGALLSPVGLVVAAVAGLTAWWATSTDAGAAAMTWLGEKFRSMGKVFGLVWQGVIDAVMAGDLALAGKIAWLGLRQVWDGGIGQLSDAWATFKGWFVEVFYQGVFAIARFLNDAWAGVRSAWVETVAFVSKLWANLVGAFEGGLEWIDARFAASAELQRAALGLVSQEEARRNIAAILGAESAADKRRRAAVDEAERQRVAAEGQIERDRLGVEGELNRMQQADQDARARARQEAADARAKELADAQKELADAVAEAGKRRAAADQRIEEAAKGPGDKPRLPGAKDVGKMMERVTGSVGTFNAAALRGLVGRGGVEDKLQKQLDRLDRLIDIDRKLLDQVRDGARFV